MRKKYVLENEGLLVQLHDPYTWALSQVFAKSELTYNDGCSYICIVAHTATAAYEPGTGADWEDVFILMAQGTTGATGAQGIPGGTLAWHGAYAADHAYAANDGVLSSEGRAFYCLQASTGNAPPSYPDTTNAYWSLFAEKGEAGDFAADGSVPMTGALTMTQIATPSEPGAGLAAIYPKTDGKFYGYANGDIEQEIGGPWHRIYGCFTATPASTSTLTMTTDKTATIKVGMGLKYKISSTYYYGMVTAITSGLLTIAGAPLGGDVLELYWCPPERVIQVDFFIAGTFADAANTGLLASDTNTAFDWNLAKAYCVCIRHKVKTDDSGAAQPNVTVSIAGSVVGTDNTNAGLAVAETWTSTVVGINTSNYDINPDEAIEIVTDESGTNNDAQNLTISLLFVFE